MNTTPDHNSAKVNLIGQHTPGPYMVMANGVGIFIGAEGHGGRPGIRNVLRGDNALENAYLLAAATKLLELAKDVESCLGDLLCDVEIGEPDPDEDPLVGLLRDARAAIASAKGAE